MQWSRIKIQDCPFQLARMHEKMTGGGLRDAEYEGHELLEPPVKGGVAAIRARKSYFPRTDAKFLIDFGLMVKMPSLRRSAPGIPGR